MISKILDRYLYKEVFGPFIFAVIGFILIGIVDTLFTLVDMLVNKGVAIGVVAKLLLFRIPSIVVLFMPMAVLFAVMILIIRTAKDSELTVLRASGVSIARIIRPILIFAISVTMVAYLINDKIVPWTNTVSNSLIRKTVLKESVPNIAEKVFFKESKNRYFYVEKINIFSKTFSNVMIYETTDVFPKVIIANSAKWQKDKWILFNGKVHKYTSSGFLDYEMSFDKMIVDVSYDPAYYYQNQKTSSEMTAKELYQKIEMYKKSGITTTQLDVDYYMKYAISGASLVFGLIGLMLTIMLVKSGKDWWKVIVSILLALTMVGFYFFMVAFFRSFGYGNIISPFWAAWAPNCLFGVLSVILIIRESFFK